MANSSSAATCAAAALLLVVLAAVASATEAPRGSLHVEPLAPRPSVDCEQVLRTFLLCFSVENDIMKFFTGHLKNLQPECCELFLVYMEKCARKDLPYRESPNYLYDMSCDPRFSAAPAPQPAAADADYF
ncbi:hypothetical protein KSP39_PZI014777 [Platanthera zijinensis]|uniref:Prolamin-like domain-containing protein n=1 Tax=Platanthera zijinensis TaxID=2320716 RepID=A0AAP0G2P2_9ASPA